MTPNPPQVAEPAEITAYRAFGFDLRFYPPRQKYPLVKGWPSPSSDAAQYRAGYNVGVMLGGEIQPGRYLVDLDFDHEASVYYAAHFGLADTEFAFGHGDSQLTHAFFTTPQPLSSRQFKALGSTLFEVRALAEDGTVGLQTMLPPSVHPNGEMLTMRFPSPRIGHVSDAERFEQVTRYVAVATLLEGYFGEGGFNHDVRLPVSGLLLKLGVPAGDVIMIVEHVATRTNNTVAHAAEDARHTASRFKAGAAVNGAEALKGFGANGKGLVQQIRAFLKPAAGSKAADQSAISDAIAALNERHAIISVGNKVVVMEQGEAGDIRELWPFEEFKRAQIKNQIEEPAPHGGTRSRRGR